ncbi:hypothetical protein GB928_025265 [Shinella curvata]|uniref:Uncharacterized protein n=1 Tax=Shinella curvata TaxID=1817964 RepID=A0ABT8XLA5_9HYPH|nr:hypothetical protein [Shinella curvata]MCJ8056653.1 hypothetical protein [Shinella curvata]MDO6124507.1 hypothetical protein [Shinella curvata]
MTDDRQIYFGDYAGDGAIRPDGKTIARTAHTVDETASLFTIDNQLQYDASAGIVENKLLVGLDYNRWNLDGVNQAGAGYLFDNGLPPTPAALPVSARARVPVT